MSWFRWPLRALIALLVLLSGLLPAAPPVQANTITVNSSADTSSGSCATTCTLRDALLTAGVGDTIQFASSIFTIRLSSTLTLTRDVTIQGRGAQSLAIDGQSNVRVLTVNSGVNATITGLTIQNGAPQSPASRLGGGIQNHGTLSLVSSVVTGNVALVGGGIYNDGSLTVDSSQVTTNESDNAIGGGIASAGTLRVTNSTISGNTVAGFGGGGIAISGATSTATVTNSTISSNLGGGGDDGGGILVGSGQLTVTDSVLSGNAGTTGGGISVKGGNATVTRTLLQGNHAVRGAGLYNDGTSPSAAGTLTVISSTISGNGPASASAVNGGGIYTGSNGTTTVTGSTVSGNSASTGAGLLTTGTGGLTLTNSTVSGNTASTSGGGLWIDGGTATFTHVTMSNNAGPSAGGILKAGGTVHLRNSIVANSPSGGNCNATIISDGNNLSDTNACFAGGSQGDIVDGSPGLAPLAVNSPGSTATHALQTGSPAIDGVTFNPTECGTTITTDQRGIARPQTAVAARCDIGAFEVDDSPLPTISAIDDQTTAEDTPTSPIPFTIGDRDTPIGQLTVTATSGNPALVLTSSMQLSGSGTSRAIRLTPAQNQSGTASIDVAVADGTHTVHETFTLTVTAVNDAPVAQNDSYSIGAGQTLTVPTATGLLANDTDVDSPPASLSVSVVSQPAHGIVTLNPDGGFAYTPTASFAGTDSFTYRASDGAATSNSATVTVTVVASDCSPRPRVVPSPAAGGGKLNVHVEATPLNSPRNNPLQQVIFDTLDNAKVTVNGQVIAEGFVYQVPANTVGIDFVVQRATPGQATTVRFTVVDGCGSWHTFVGGGTSAGF